MNNRSTQGDNMPNERRSTLFHQTSRLWRSAFVAILVMGMLTITFPSARAADLGGSSCTSSVTGNTTTPLCLGIQGDFATSQWNSGWTHLYINNQPCNGNTNSYSDSYNYNGGLYGAESVRADSSSGCSTNTAEVQINVGLHGQSFTAWKSGTAYYTVVANYTFHDYQALATYCQVSGSPSAKANITALSAMYDDSTGTGVGASTNGGYDVIVIWQTCNNALNHTDTGDRTEAQFTTSTAIKYGDTLVPRGSVTADVWVSSPSTYPFASHAASVLDFNNDGYGYITLDSIWVY